jgi:autotransporter-associated beta strand protein
MRTAATNITLTTAVNNHLAFIGSSASLDANGGDVTISLSGSGSAFVASGDATTDIIANALSITSGVDGIGADGNPLTFNASSLTTNTTGKLDGLQFLSAANSVSVLGLNAGTSTVRLVSGTFQSSASNVIADATNISLDHRATLDLNNFSDTIGALTLEIGTGNGADVTTGTGTLTLGGNVTLTTINQGAIGATISGNLSLGGATRTISVDNGNAVNDLVISANVSGTNVGLQKTGTGNLVLSGTNTYTGATTVSDGSLSLNGSITSNTTVADGATLNGAGTINSGNTLTVQSGGTVAPGTSPGILNTGNVTLQSGSTFNVELNGTTAGTGYDQLNVTGTVTINSNVTLNPSLGFTPAPGDTFVIINNDGTDDVSGPFDGLEQGKLLTIGGAKFHIHYFHDSADTVGGAVGNDVALIANRNPLINNQMFSLGEDSENGAEVGSVMASDPDAALASIIGVGGSQSGGGQSSGGFTVINIGTVFVPRTPPVTFAITAGNVGNAFAIGSDTGIITVNDASAVDFETNPTFNLTVEVTDDAGATSTATVTINLANVAPSIPVDADSAPNRVSDTDLNGATVGITASSSDVHGGAITYSLTDDANGRFTIGMTSGIVTVANASLIQPVTTYSITVQASDGTDSSSQTFAIDAFFDAPDAPQDVDRQENSVPEGAPQGSRVGVTAFALDHQDDDVFYQLIDDAGGRFDIDLVTGVVTVERSSLLVFQGNPTRHTIQVQATDERGNVTAVVPFTIDVTEVPDLSPPIASILPTRTSVVEGDFGTPFANFKVQLNKTSTDTITVDFITRRGDAPNFTLPDGIPNDPNLFASDGTGGPTDPLGPRDFFLTTGRLTFAPGVDEQPIRIPIRPDDRPEPNEFFFVQLLSPVNASLAPQQSVAIAQILDDDSVPQLLVSNAQVLEGDGVGEPNKLVFTVNLVGDFPPGETTATVDFMTGNPLIDSATADDDPAAVNDPTLADYVATSGTLTFTNSTRLQTIEVTILGDLLNTPDENALNIADETLTLRFENEMNLGLARRTVTGTIINDDDNNVVLSLTPNPSDLRAVREGNAGDLLPIEFVVTLVGKTTETVTVNFATVDISATGSATAAATPGLVADYTSTSGMLTFLPGEVTQTFTVLVRGDTDVEADEAFNVVISLPATSQPNVTIDPDRASSTIVIRNDDQAIPTEDGDELVEQLTDAFNAGGGAKNPAVVAMLREQAMQFIEANGLTDYILIIVDPVDVILTDPQNRSTGFTETPQTIRGTTVQGVVNQIPGTYYSGDGNVEVLVVPLPAAGTYNVQLVGLGNSSVSGDFSASVTVVSGTQARTTAISSSLAEGSTTSIAVQVGNGNFVIPLGLGLAAARSGNNQTIEAVGSLNQAAFNNLVAQFFSNLPPGVFDNLATNQPLTDAEVRQRAAKLLTKFDKNNDNAITADEVGEEEWKALLKFDLNGDGRITVEELEAQIRADNEPKPQPPTEPGNGSPPKQNRPQGEGQQGKAQPGTQERSRATPSESPNKTSRAVPPGAGKGQSSSLQTSRSGRDGSQQANATRAWWNALRFWGEKNSDRSREIRNA